MDLDYNILGKLDSPAFIFDEKEFYRGVNGFYEALRKYFAKPIIGYSVKTNSLPYAIEKAVEYGCFAEVVSHDEYRLARLCGCPIDKIIYNGPNKSRQTFLEAIQGGAVVNIETHRELQWLSELPEEGNYGVGLRVNVNIADISPDDSKENDTFSRFGFSVASGEFDKAIEYIDKLKNVKLVGLHFHRTSKTRSVEFYRHLSQFAAGVIKGHNLNLEYLDMGGGYFGIFPNSPTFQDYAGCFCNALKDVIDPVKTKFIVEPGNALTASAFKYVATVIDVKQQPELSIVTTDGSRNDIDPLFQKQRYLKKVVYSTAVNGRENVPLQWVTGATCLEFDKILPITDDYKLIVGDKIVFNNVGAYTMCLTPLFINYFPTVYATSDNGCTFNVVRGRWSAEDFLKK